jgi:hypothetical protein
MPAAILAGTIPTTPNAAEKIHRAQFTNDLPRRLSSLPVGKMATMPEIIGLRPPRTGLDDQIFNAVCEIQEDLRALEFADALALVSETMDESTHANAINRLAWEIKRRARSVETRRDDLLCLARRTSIAVNRQTTLPRLRKGACPWWWML